MLVIKVSTKTELKKHNHTDPPSNKMDLAFMKRWVLSIRVLLLSLAVVLNVSSGMAAEPNPPIHLCDELAAHPSDPNKVGEGVSFDDIDTDKAQAACMSAVELYPNTMRFELQLGRTYARQKNQLEAVKWYRKAAEQGSASAQLNLGVKYDNGVGVAEDNTEAVRWYRLAAEQGHAPAQKSLGYMYDNGEGVAEDNTEAVRWYRLAAEQGHAPAQYNLGYMYDDGEGVAENDTEAVRWYRLAAEQDYADAQYNLGQMYEFGEGLRVDETEAVRWYRLAAEQGDGASMAKLGEFLVDGRGIEKKIEEGMKWLKKASETGEVFAQTLLFDRYLNPDNHDFNAKKAAELIKLSASNEKPTSMATNYLPLAKYRYYELLSRGYGIEKNSDEALKWLKFAADDGQNNAKIELAYKKAVGDGFRTDHQAASILFEELKSDGIQVPLFYNKNLNGDENQKTKLPCTDIWQDNDLLSTPPEKDQFIPIDIEFSHNGIKNISINTRNQTVSALVDLEYSYRDYRFLHDVGIFPYICKFPAHTLWENQPGQAPVAWGPGIEALNVNGAPYTQTALVEINEYGVVTYRSKVSADFRTVLDLKSFPFDTQSVSLNFGSNINPINMIRLTSLTDQDRNCVEIKLPLSHEWSSSKSCVSFSKEWRGDNWHSTAALDFSIKRNPFYYVTKIILPLFILFLVSTSQFWLKWDRLDARASIAATSLVAVIAYQFLIQDDLPKLPYLTLLDHIIFLTFIMIGLGIAEFVLVFTLVAKKDRFFSFSLFGLLPVRKIGPEDLAEKIDLHSRYGYPLIWLIGASILMFGPVWQWSSSVL
jgi:TPR repeat protein